MTVCFKHSLFYSDFAEVELKLNIISMKLSEKKNWQGNDLTRI